MIQYDDSKCDKHGQKRCVLCMAAAAKGGATVSQAVVAGPPPSSISGGPPENIEGLSGSVRDRIPVTVEEAETDYDKILAEVKTLKDEPISAGSVNLKQAQERQNNQLPFATLPTDDSHASKVMCAAAKYAEAAKSWAVLVADTEKIKRTLIEAEAKLNSATEARIDAEDELKKLINGSTT